MFNIEKKQEKIILFEKSKFYKKSQLKNRFSFYIKTLKVKVLMEKYAHLNFAKLIFYHIFFVKDQKTNLEK